MRADLIARLKLVIDGARPRAARWRRWWALHLRWWRSDLWLLAKRSVSEFLDDHCAQLAASMSYYIFFSLFPLAILVVSIAGVFLTNADLRREVVDGLFEILPLPSGAGREDLESLIDPIASGSSAIGIVSILGLLWAATGMMSALRFSLDTVWDLEFRRPFVRGKLVDMALVLGVGGLLAMSISATAVLQVGREVSDSVADSLGPFGAEATGFFNVIAVLLPFLLTWLTFGIVYVIVPSVSVRKRDVIAGALVGALLFEVLKFGFSVYLRNFSNYDAVYGSLGAAIALLFFVYLGACVLLFGAEIAAEWPRVMHGHYDEDDPSDAAEAAQQATLRERLRDAAVRQLKHEQEIPANLPAAETRDARQQRRASERSRRLGDH